MKTNIFITVIALAAILLIGCTRGTQESYITLTTAKEVGETIKLTIDAAEADRTDVWIDLNNNGIKDEGETVTNFGKNAETEYKLGAQTVTIHGKVNALWCRSGQFTMLDILGNPELIELECSHNQLTELDASNSTKLAMLHCYNNQLTVLNISNSLQLTNLECSHNQLTTLDVSSNPELISLSCFGNQLTTLDLSNNSNLKWLNCGNNKLGMLDLSKNLQLNDLYCGGNQLTSLDLLSNTELETLSCPRNQLTALDLSNNPKLQKIYCETNNISGDQMSALVNSLPDRIDEYPGEYVLRYWLEDGNTFDKAQESILSKKNWYKYEECAL